MKNALWVLACISVVIGVTLAIVTVWFAVGLILRIIAVIVAIIGIFIIIGFIVWSWWTECVVEPYLHKRKLKQQQKKPQ